MRCRDEQLNRSHQNRNRNRLLSERNRKLLPRPLDRTLLLLLLLVPTARRQLLHRPLEEEEEEGEFWEVVKRNRLDSWIWLLRLLSELGGCRVSSEVWRMEQGGLRGFVLFDANSILCFGHASLVHSRVSSSASGGLDVEDGRGEDAN